VRDSFNEARVRPPSNPQQRLENFQLTVNPAAPVNHYTDFYGNGVDHFDVAEPHTALELETRAVVTTFAPELLALDARPATLAAARQAGQGDPCFDFVQASRFTDTSPGNMADGPGRDGRPDRCLAGGAGHHAVCA
jgi:transglutaminase-like putative cysteine protease